MAETQTQEQTETRRSPISTNVLVFDGNLAADPDQLQGAKGSERVRFRVAINHPNGDASFVSVTAWGKDAVSVAQYLKKGAFVVVTGRIALRMRQESDGTQIKDSKGSGIYDLQVSATSVRFGPKNGSGGGGQQINRNDI